MPDIPNNQQVNQGAGKSISGTLDKWFQYAGEGFMWLGGILLVMISMLTVVDVLGRSVIRTPVQGTIEIIEMMLVCITFSGIVYTTAKNGHVKVELILNRLPGPARKILGPLMVFTGSVAFGLLSWQLGLAGTESISAGLHTSTLAIPIAPFQLIAAICSGLTCLFLMKDFIFSIRR